MNADFARFISSVCLPEVHALAIEHLPADFQGNPFTYLLWIASNRDVHSNTRYDLYKLARAFDERRQQST